MNNNITKLQIQFLQDLKNIMIKYSTHKKKLLLFSGGIDSLTILCLLLDIYPKHNLQLLTLTGTREDDRLKARETASYFGLKNQEYYISFNDIINSLHILKGTKINGVYSALYYICMYLLFTKNDIKDCDIYWGEGADSLYGSVGVFTYRGAKSLAKQNNISMNAALQLRRKQVYEKALHKPTVKLLKQLANNYHSNLILPFKYPEVSYLVDVDRNIIKPDNKSFIKTALREQYQLPQNLLKRKRIIMQEGTGYFELFRDYLQKNYNSLARNPTFIVRKLTYQQSIALI